MKGTRHLEDIFADANSVEHHRVFNPYAAGTQVNTYHNSKWESKIPTQQIMGSGAMTDMSDGRQDCDIGGDIPKIEIMKSSQSGRNGEIKTKSGQISHRPEGWGLTNNNTNITYLGLAS